MFIRRLKKAFERSTIISQLCHISPNVYTCASRCTSQIHKIFSCVSDAWLVFNEFQPKLIIFQLHIKLFLNGFKSESSLKFKIASDHIKS